MSAALLSVQRFRTLNVLDDFSREVLAEEVDTNLPAARIIRVLGHIAAWRGYLAKLRMDNGPEFIFVQLADWAEQHWSLSSQASLRRTHTWNGSTVPSAMKY